MNNFHLRDCLGWASSRVMYEGCIGSSSDMCTLQTFDTEWKTLPVFDPYIGGSADRGQLYLVEPDMNANNSLNMCQNLIFDI